MKRKVIVVQVDDDLYEQIKELATQSGLPYAAIARAGLMYLLHKKAKEYT